MPLSSLFNKISEDDIITLIVAQQHCDLYDWDLARVLGYYPDRLELRYYPDQVEDILSDQRCSLYTVGILPQPTSLWKKWSQDWVSLQGQARIDQKRRLEHRMVIVEQNLQETERREVAAGKLDKGRMLCRQGFRKEDAAERKKKKIIEAMAIDDECYEQMADAYERSVLVGDNSRGGEGKGGKKNRLMVKMIRRSKSLKLGQGSSAAARRLDP